MQTMHLLPGVAIQPNLELKTRPRQLLGSLPLVIALPGEAEFLCLQGCAYPLHQSERERERERGREGERERCIIWLFLCVKEMTGALAPFSYLVKNNNSVDNNGYLKRCFNKPV